MAFDVVAVEAHIAAEARYRRQLSYYLDACFFERLARRGLCRWPTCWAPAPRGGFCRAHAEQKRKGILGRARPYRRRVRVCSEPSCTAWPLGHGLCRSHWDRKIRLINGALTAEAREEPLSEWCSFGGCVRRRVTKGMCAAHYTSEWRRTHERSDRPPRS